MLAPKKLAIIMDGNGRWAQKRGLPRNIGHLKGTRVAKKIISACADLGVEQLVLYAFSAENWRRPPEEVSFLMRILERYLKKETPNLIKKKIRFKVAGDLNKLPSHLVTLINETIKATASCQGLEVIFALSYGSRQELVEVVKKISQQVSLGQLDEKDINETTIFKNLWIPVEPDLIIRTSGELRISNFLLWQISYSEFYFTSTLWPDFTEVDLLKAFESYRGRQRRFGGLSDETELLGSNNHQVSGLFSLRSWLNPAQMEIKEVIAPSNGPVN